MLRLQVAVLFLGCKSAAGLPEHCTKVVGSSGGSKGGSTKGGSSGSGEEGNGCCSASYCAACCGKSVGDTCFGTLSEGVCCTVDSDGTRTCQDCEKEVNFTAACTLHSRNGNMGCFSPPEVTEPTYHACEGQKRGDKCIAGSMVGECILHYDHGALMCLEAVGFSGECEGLGVGQSCPVGCPEENHLCSHHSRTGSMMCIVPTGSTDSAIVCDGKDPGDFCGYIQEANPHTSKQGGYFEGVCHPHDANAEDTHMLCTLPENLPSNKQSEDVDGSWGSRSPAAILAACAPLLLH